MTTRDDYFPRRGTKVLEILLALADGPIDAELGLHEISERWDIEPDHVYGRLEHAIEADLITARPGSRPTVYLLGRRGADTVAAWRARGEITEREFIVAAQKQERAQQRARARAREDRQQMATSIALPNRIDIMHCPVYRPAPWTPTRPGAMDHHRHASRGYRC